MNTKDNPFSPPTATSRKRTRRRGSRVLAVFVGVLADIGGSTAVGFLIIIIAATIVGSEGIPSEQVETALLNPNSWFAIISFVVGCAFSFLGGYLCARIARHAEYQLAAFVAAIVTAFGLLVGFGRVSIVLNLFLAFLTVLSVMLGAWRGALRNRVAGIAA